MARSMTSSASTPLRRLCAVSRNRPTACTRPQTCRRTSRDSVTGFPVTCSIAIEYRTGWSVRASPDREVVLGPVLAGLVIGHAKRAGVTVLLDQVDGAAQREAAVNVNGIRVAARIPFV